MRRQLRLRARRRVVAGALGLATVLTAGASAAAQAPTQGAIDARLLSRTIRSGQRATVAGRIPSGANGVPVALEFQRPGGAWSTLARSRTGAGGWLLLAAPLVRSGNVRVTSTAGDQALAASTTTTELSSQVRFVAVRAALAVRRVHGDVLAGAPVTVAGALRPAGAHRLVTLQLLDRGHWHEVARTRTGSAGGYHLRYRPSTTGSWRARVRFGGDAANAASIRTLRGINAYRLAGASWYGPGFWGGPLACGGRLEYSTLGVANRTLPCGTQVTLHYGSRTVRVPVIDRGPYVGGRDFDLTEATKRALGFPDTGLVWSSR